MKPDESGQGAGMTPYEFIRKWKNNALTERAAAQEHFLDICKLVGHPSPADLDPTGEFFTFEKGASKTGGGDGFADVWKKGHFAWEYKKRRRDLDAAMKQLVDYAAALDSPPLHIVCDTIRFRIETRWTNTVTAKHEFELEDLADQAKIDLLKAAFHDPETLRPKQTRASLTREAADKFQTISDRLQHRNGDKEAVAHFVNQLVFCFFASSVKLLPDGLLRKLIETAIRRPSRSKEYFDKLFAEMEKPDGEFDLTSIKHFNGGLFDGRRALALDIDELALLRALHSFRWDLIDPTIFGTLFERFLDPDKRAQIGAHYTDEAKIMQIVEPVVMRPLRAEWAGTYARIEAIMRPVLDEEAGAARALGKRFEEARGRAEALRDAFVERLTRLSILDPACGSGNFLYLALQAVKDLEYAALLQCEALLLRRVLPRVSPKILHGIELNPLAAELARSVIWIGDIQWGIRNGFTERPEPILEKLDSIECRDALMMPDGQGGWRETPWPQADFVIGNPPFLGGKKFRRELGDSTVDALFTVYDGRVPREADLVCYWFARVWEQMKLGRIGRAGLVATNSIRGGANRRVLDPIADAEAIFEAWSDEAWVVDGAAVRVSLVCFAAGEADDARHLDGLPVTTIHADLTAGASDLTKAKPLKENAGVAFMGDTKGGAFDIAGALARSWLREPLNPNGRPNSDVLKPWVNGLDVTRQPRDMWIIDFGSTMNEADAALYEEPFAYIREHVLPERLKNNRKAYRDNWWWHVEPRPAMWEALKTIVRYLVTPRVASHRSFGFFDTSVCCDSATIAIARDDDTTFGILHARFHEAWSLRLGTSLEDRPRYTPSTTFETYPFPEGLTPNVKAEDYAADPRAVRIAAAAKRLDELRRAWLCPADLGDWVPEITPTAAPGEEPRRYPDRFQPKSVEAQVKLKARTLTNLYNQRPQWLTDAHAALDRAVAAAYGWPEDISEDDALGCLLST